MAHSASDDYSRLSRLRKEFPYSELINQTETLPHNQPTNWWRRLRNQMARPFPRTEPAWSLRAYLVLMGCAADRQTVTYEDLARRIDRGGPNLLARPLNLITRWCQRHSLPAIASLVVEQATGLPAPGFAAVTRDEIPHEQERVWDFDWFGILPPTIEELAES